MNPLRCALLTAAVMACVRVSVAAEPPDDDPLPKDAKLRLGSDRLTYRSAPSGALLPPDYNTFLNALPILGKDGTLAKIQVSSPAAGHVFAKTGTFGSDDRLNERGMLNGKGLAGYVVTKSGRTIAFAAYVNHTSLENDPDAAQNIAGQALGEIAAAAYEVLP